MSKSKKFEYKQKYFGSNELAEYEFSEYLNDEGREGWELVNIIERMFITNPTAPANYTFIFKREIMLEEYK